jgi:hypothetical protein
MTSYVIASNADNPILAQCQILSEYAMLNSPDIHVTIVVKDKSEWD